VGDNPVQCNARYDRYAYGLRRANRMPNAACRARLIAPDAKTVA